MDDRYQWFHRLLDLFVSLHGGMTQRGPEWYKSMATTVGGSEMAALLGMNPYSKKDDVILSKALALGGLSDFRGGEACWWGTLFEDNIEAYVAADLGAPVKGSDICVRAVAGHRNSPDGYIVAQFYEGPDGFAHLWTTDMSRDLKMSPRILLLEFKCPLSRQPDGKVPRQYKPQVWSGLAVSPVAHLGLFVDAVFRKCALADLGDTPAFDRDYHYKAAERAAGVEEDDQALPVAWGLTFVYAPRVEAPRRVRLGWRGEEWAAGDPDPEAYDADGAHAAWQIYSAAVGHRPGEKPYPADLGAMEKRLFVRSLGLIDKKLFRVVRSPPCFADGRGVCLHDCEDIADAIYDARKAAPPDYWLLGVLPWKLFDVCYVPVRRRPGFMAEVLPLIQEVHRVAAEAHASGDAAAFLRSRKYDELLKAEENKPKINMDELQDLFDAITL